MLHMLTLFVAAATATLVAALPAARAPQQQPEPRRLEVLFFGAPTANGPHHDPITRYATLKQALGTEGIDLTYSEDPAEAFRAATLSAFDAVLMYGNWEQRGQMPKEQLDALLAYVDNGGGFVPVHCASACFGLSPRFVRLVGARFVSHGGEQFAPQNVAPDHPILKGLSNFTAWDETYVHEDHQRDREILQVRGGEPWSWTRQQGKGRVFYTASGHDHRVWDRSEFQQLLRNAIYWAVGDDKRALLHRLALPQLETEAVSLPGYRQRQEITVAQQPLSPRESAKLAQVPVGMQLELFASEPDIVNPIHVAWDERGRAFVVETIDYPNNLQAGNLGHDRITICADTDGDGRADRFTRFAEQLSIPTSLTFARGGVICTNGTEMLFLQDTDGDDKADVRQVLFEGLHMGDTHADVSNLRCGPDGWIWATVGYSGFGGTVGGVRHDFEQGVFRFRSDGSALEFVQHTTNNTWGLAFTADGDVVGSTANGNPSFYVTFPDAEYRAVGLEPHATPRADDDPKFFPMSQDIRQVDFFDRYTAAAGHALATGDRLPADWNDRIAFVCEPTGKLVARFELERRGGGFVARQSPNNLFASADAWTAPVCAEVGPDGAVWICDWYNLIVQHNPTPTRNSAGVDAKTGRGNAYVTPLRDTQHGRIWRVFPRGSSDRAMPSLADPNAQLAALASPHHGVRLMAQRLLTERNDPAATPALHRLVDGAGIAAPHALHVLAAREPLATNVIVRALRARNTALARAAMAHADVDAVKQAFVGGGNIAAADRLLAEAMVALAHSAADPAIGNQIFAIGYGAQSAVFGDTTLRDAWTIAARRHADTVLAAADAQGMLRAPKTEPVNVLPNPDFAATDAGGRAPAGWSDLRIYSGARAPTVQLSQAPDGRNGTPCLCIRSAEMSDCGAAAVVAVRPATRYRLSGWIKTADVTPRRGGDGVMLNVHGGVRTKGVRGTSDWTEVGVEFDSGDQHEIVVHCLFGGYGGAVGTAWFDDVALVALGARDTLAGALEALDAWHKEHAGSAVAAAPIQRQFAIDPAVHERGAAVFGRTCIACHGIDGKGQPPMLPPLDGSRWLNGDARRPIDIVLNGLMGPIEVDGTRFDGLMPPLGPMLQDADIADVLTYVRQRWSNDAAPVTTEQVAARRKANRDHPGLWTAAELDR